MNIEQLSRLRAMVECGMDGRKEINHWDLNREDANAIFAAIQGMPSPRFVAALEAVLLFYHAGPWESEQRSEWDMLTGGADCTTKGLCDFIRKRLAEPFSEDVRGTVRSLACGSIEESEGEM